MREMSVSAIVKLSGQFWTSNGVIFLQVTIKDLSGFTSDNVPVLVSGSLFFRVNNSYDACFSVNDFQTSVLAIGTSATRSIIGHFTVSSVHTANNLMPS